jgi:tetratricopeptide (TPR) repeat protein
LLTEAARLDPDNENLFSMLARAYWDKAAWQLSIDAADRAIAINASNAQAYLWRADSRRQLAAVQSEKSRAQPFWLLAREDYRTFLDLTNFSTSLGSKLAFHFIGMGVGSRRHADRQGAYDSLRSAGFLGLCISEQRVANPLKARTYCERGLKHAPKDPIAHFLLGNVNRDLYNSRPSCDVLKAAKKSYVTMIGINPDLNESGNAKNYVAQIDGLLPRLKCG